MTETKTYEIQGQRFHLKPDSLKAKKYGIKLVAHLEKLNSEYMKGIDWSPLEKYTHRIEVMEVSIAQIKELITKNADEMGENEKASLESRIVRLNEELDKKRCEMEDDHEAKELAKLKKKLEQLSLGDMLSDLDLLLPVFKEILTGGDICKIDWALRDAEEFMMVVVTDFFSLIGRNKQR